MSKRHNAALLTRTRRGTTVRTNLHLSNLSSDLQMQISEAQTKRGIIRRPIRLQERMLTYSALYPAIDRARFEQEMSRIIDHWVFNLNSGQGVPMRLLYQPGGPDSSDQGGATEYVGFIQAFSKEYAWDDVLWERQFRMRLLAGARVQGASLTKRLLHAPYIPHAGDVAEFGPAWYTVKQLRELGSELGNRHKASNHKADHQPGTSGSGTSSPQQTPHPSGG